MSRQNLHVHYSAEDYDRYTQNAVREFDDGMMRRARQEQRIMLCRAPRLLDVGTGTAQLLLKMARSPRFDRYTLVGTDYFEDMVETARQVVDEAGFAERIQVDQNDVHELPYESESFDIVTSRSTIHHWENPPRAFEEIYRVLRPNGVAIIHEPRRDPHPDALDDFNRRRAELGIEAARLDEKYTPDEVGDFLIEAGLRRKAVINAPRSGPSSMGFEVRLAKSNAVRVDVFRKISRVRTAFHWW